MTSPSRYGSRRHDAPVVVLLRMVVALVRLGHPRPQAVPRNRRGLRGTPSGSPFMDLRQARRRDHRRQPVTPFLAEVLAIRDDTGAVWVIWRATVDPLDRFETFELTRKETL
jgi:hypothetical protein